jgi:hypothetical protein
MSERIEKYIICNQEETPSQKRKRLGGPLLWDNNLKCEDFDVKLDHLETRIDLRDSKTEAICSDVNSYEILNILKETQITEEDFKNCLTHNYKQMFTNKESMIYNIKSVIEYAEEDKNAGSNLKNKLRLITKFLRTNHEAQPGILLMLAQHGGACNVMKEVGIDTAYSLLLDQMKIFFDKQTLNYHINTHLSILRALIIEEQYLASFSHKNTHPIVAFRNVLAPYIGLEIIPDEDRAVGQEKHVVSNEKVQEFYKRYSVKRIMEYLKNVFTSRKIHYVLLVDWLKENSLHDDSYAFLEESVDENGEFTERTILYILHKMNFIE